MVVAAVGTGVVVIVVAVAVVSLALLVTLAARGRQRREVKQRAEVRQDLAEAREQAPRYGSDVEKR